MRSPSKQEQSAIRVLYREFLFRIVELESLSSKADIAKLLGQFASILVMFSLIQMLAGLLFMDVKMEPAARQAAVWTMEYQVLSLTLLVAGLFCALSWEALLPDQRDAFVLGSLPVRPSTLCISKVLASASIIGLSAFALNSASGLVWPAALAQAGFISVLRSYLAYWLTLLIAVMFLLAAVLLIQSAAALLLPRTFFLRVSPILQLVLSAVLLASYFLEPTAPTPESLALQSHLFLVAWFPPYCFTAVFFQLQGSLPRHAHLVADCGWALLMGCLLGATLCSATLYGSILSRVASTPDLVRRRSTLSRVPFMSDSLESTLLLFIGRSFSRSKQQKLIAAFYLGVGSAVLFALLGPASTRSAAAPAQMSVNSIVSTIVMMTVVIVGFRASFALPVYLKANWVFRLHQIEAAPPYLRATRHALILFTVLPVCVVSLIFGLIFEPVGATLEHVLLLGLYGAVLSIICLYGNQKLPYTCSYLPGTSQVQFLFWGCFIPFLPLTFSWATVEQRYMHNFLAFAALCFMLLLCVYLLERRSRARETDTILEWDDVPEDVIVGLGLTAR